MKYKKRVKHLKAHGCSFKEGAKHTRVEEDGDGEAALHRMHLSQVLTTLTALGADLIRRQQHACEPLLGRCRSEATDA